jgi:hypothetical protein
MLAGGFLAVCMLIAVAVAGARRFGLFGQGPSLGVAAEDDLEGPGAPPIQPAVGPGSAEPAGNPLAVKALAIFKENCYRCHGEDGADEGDFNYLLERDRLVSARLVVPGNAGESKLFQYVAKGLMPADSEPLAAADLDALRKWIDSGAPNFAAPLERVFITHAEMVRFVRQDLERVSPRDRRFTRYFTLTNLYNSGFSDEELETYRLALAKLVNSLSWQSELRIPRPVDPAATVLRIDLRDFDWDEAVWQKIVKANPYSVVWNVPDYKACSELTDCEIPDVRADWFVAAASHPPLYHDVLQLPSTLKGLLEEKLLAIDLDKNIRQDRVARAGFARSGVSQHNRMLERHESPYGYFWISYDFGGDTGRKNIFKFPLGPGSADDRFQHDGGEVIFSLPNGLQGYLLVDSTGKRIDKAPTEIVTDPKRPGSAVVNGISCMSCHFGGMIPKADEIRPHVETNRAAFSEADDILALFRPSEELAKHFEQDGQRFVNSVKQLGIDRVTPTGEPIVNMAQRFESELDRKMAAAEMGLRPEELTARLRSAPDLARVLGAVSAGGLVKRDVFIQSFVEAVETFGLGTGVNPRPTQVAQGNGAKQPAAPAQSAANPPAPNPPAPNPPAQNPPAQNPPAQNPANPSAAAPPARPAVPPAAPAAQVRTWTNRDGLKIEAEFVESVQGIVRVKMADGRIYNIPLENLSDADQQFVISQAPGQNVDAPPPDGDPAAPAPGAVATPGQPPAPGGNVAKPPVVPAKPVAAPAGPVFRRWLNVAIDKTIVARFSSLNNGDLRLEQQLGPDLVPVKWPIAHMCPADHQYVRDLLGPEEYDRHKDLPADAFGPKAY